MPPFRLSTIVKALCAMVVITVMIITWVLYHHMAVSPLDGAVAKIIPEPGSAKQFRTNDDLKNILISDVMPDIDPGERAFQSAYVLLEKDKFAEARQKLTAVYEIYPNSTSAATAKRIVGEMNLDQILSTQDMTDKQVHTVKSGDSYLGIASKHNTTIDCMMHLNSMLRLEGIQPGDRLLVMPLELTLRVEPNKKVVSLWRGETFIREYPALSMRGVSSTKRTMTIDSIIAEIDGLKILPHQETYAAANKVIQLSSSAIQIRQWDDTLDELSSGIFMRPRDMQEIALLTRSGNSVEIR